MTFTNNNTKNTNHTTTTTNSTFVTTAASAATSRSSSSSSVTTTTTAGDTDDIDADDINIGDNDDGGGPHNDGDGDGGDPEQQQHRRQQQQEQQSTAVNYCNTGSSNGRQIQRTTLRRTKPFVYVVAATAAIGAVIFGFSLTGAGGTFVMTSFQEYLGGDGEGALTSREESLITSLQSVGSVFGAVLNSFPVDRIGRKYTIAVACLVFAVGASLQCSAPSGIIEVLYVGRLVSGFGIGMFAMTVPLYIAECSPSHRRGQLTTFWQVGVTVGMLFGQGVNVVVADVEYGWRLSYGTPIVLAVLLAIAMITYMPESPRFIAASVPSSPNHGDEGNNEEQQRQQQKLLVSVLSKLRYEDEIEHSLGAINGEVEEERELGVASWREIFRQSHKMRYRVLLGVGIQFLNQLSGNETINFYAPTILEDIFPSGDASLISSFGLGVVNLFAVVVALFVVDRVGRVPLWIMGGSVMLVTQILNSVLQSFDSPTTGIDITFFVSLCLFTCSYHGTMGPLAWDICAEIFPAREKAKAVGLTTMSNFVGVVLVGAVFPFMMDASPSATYALFSVCLFANIVMVYFFLPETAEKSPTQIEEDFQTHEPKLFRRNILHKE